MRSFPSLEDSSKLVFLAIAIKIVKGAEVDGPRGEAGGKRHGVFAYHADPELYPLVCGFSRQPLLDACRQLKSLYGVTGTGRLLVETTKSPVWEAVPDGARRLTIHDLTIYQRADPCRVGIGSSKTASACAPRWGRFF
jgi:hypothetical protein